VQEALDPILSAPVAPGWERIEARLDEDEHARGYHHRIDRLRSRRLQAGLAIAAGLLLVAGALVVRVGHRDPSSDRVATQPIAPTGWYVPVDLPDGWTVTTVTGSAGRTRCAGRGRAWSDRDRGIAIGLTFDACGHAATEADLPTVDLQPWPEGLPRPEGSGYELRRTDLGYGTEATEIYRDDPAEAFRPRTLTWTQPTGGAWDLTVMGLDDHQVEQVARSLAPDPVEAEPKAEGLAPLPLVDHWAHGARSTSPEVQIGLTSPDGLGAGLVLSMPGEGNRPVGSQFPTPVSIPGAPGPTVRFDTGPGGFWAGRYGGTWPGADVTIYRWTEDPEDAAKTITDAELEVLLGSLRPATTEQWHRFLDTAVVEVSPTLRAAATLADVVSDPPTSSVSPSPTSVPSTTRAPTTPTTTER
jgi:hypothetical protein